MQHPVSVTPKSASHTFSKSLKCAKPSNFSPSPSKRSIKSDCKDKIAGNFFKKVSRKPSVLTMKSEVLVAMSGGIDSSTVALKLHLAGYSVVGVNFSMWKFRPTDAKEPFIAKAVCRKIGARFIQRDIADQFYTSVVEPFIEEYRRGKTPNPCVGCNVKIKWAQLLALANELGIGKVATGHYARALPSAISGYSLLRGADISKDQSYFLYRLTPELLQRTLFPLGALTKPQVREQFARYFPEISIPAESQEICFVPDGMLKDLLRELVPDSAVAGNLVDCTGKVVGKHKGIAFYTVGQREGLGGGFRQPMFVHKILPESNTILIGTNEELLKTRFTVQNCSFIKPVAPKFDCTVRIRHLHRDTAATVTLANSIATVELAAPERAIAPGQSAVFYDGLCVIGGGIILE
jgi:tRNA-uridine 2-sulfurtransferase